MKKILTIISMVTLVSFSSNALDTSDISATIGVAANSAVYGATGKETTEQKITVLKLLKKNQEFLQKLTLLF